MQIKVRQIFDDLHPLVKLIFDTLMVLVLFFIFFSIGSIILAGIFNLNTAEFLATLSKSEDLDMVRVSQIMYSIVLFLIPPIIVSFFYSRKTFSFFGLNKSALPVSYFNVIFLILATLPIVNYMALFNGGLNLPASLSGLEEIWRNAEENAKQLTEKMMSTDSVKYLIINLIMLAVLPAIGEEIFFRGLFQKHFIEWTKNEHIGIFVTAFLFSAIHFQFYTFLPRLFLSMVLGYLFVWSKSLWLPIFAHFVNNATAVIITFVVFKQTHSLSTDIDSFGTDSNTLIYTFVSIAMFFFLMYSIYRNEKRKSAISS
ncbi:MAG: CPBP family intramembrane metalloprotease [Bacteroidales bacterium]|nr:CPBP family intramembrane metalloprotease [Bacteroidales bacterium]